MKYSWSFNTIFTVFGVGTYVTYLLNLVSHK